MLVLFLANNIQSSISLELHKFFNSFSDSLNPIDPSSIFKARQKLKFSAYSQLSTVIKEGFYQHSPQVRKWKDFCLMGIDGSTIQLPNTEDLRKKFFNKENSRPLARLSSLVDVCNGVIHDVALTPTSVDERTLALQHFAKLQKDSLLLTDRGYACAWIMAYLMQEGKHFCMRQAIGKSKQIQDFIDSGQQDVIIDYSLSKSSIETLKSFNMDAPDTIQIRLVRVELDNGGVEVLATSLMDQEEFPREEFGPLYHYRWGHEKVYRELKCYESLQEWSGKKELCIMQDLHATVMLHNLKCCFYAQVDDSQKTMREASRNELKYDYQANHKATFSVLRLHFWELFSPIKCTRNLLKFCLSAMVKIRPHPIRENRKSPRNFTYPMKPMAFAYKPC